MVVRTPLDTESKSMRKSRKSKSTTSGQRKKFQQKTIANRSRKTVAKKPRSGKKHFWNETPRWLIGAITGVIAVAYLGFVYIYYLKPYFYRWDFGDTYAGHPVVHGIDISHHQGEIDWHKLAKAEHTGSGIRFVFMKATEGSDWMDSTFQYNFAKARENGFIRGAYHFFTTTSSAEKQADFFCNQVSLQPEDLPPVLDIETRGNYGDDSLRLEIKTWLRRVEKHYGVKPIIYASRKFKERYLNDDSLDTYPFWIAHYYVDSLTYQGEWAFWQHTDKGRLPGIDGRVDMNVFNGDLQALKQFAIQPEGKP